KHSLLYLFYSSRRRHTIFSRDWSSDVCSSDLQIFRVLRVVEQPLYRRVKIVQRRLNARVAIGIEPECRNGAILTSTRTIGTTLLPDSTVQITVTQITAKHSQSGRIRMLHWYCRVRLRTEVHLGIVQPGLLNTPSDRRQRK